MKGYNGWSYAPYRPFLFEVGDIYICRIAPAVDSIHFEWLDSGDKEYFVYCGKRGENNLRFIGKTDKTEFDIVELEAETDYAFYVSADGKKSRVRLARTGETVGTVVNYLHPEDEAYSYSGKFLASPSLVRRPDGYLLASMDLYGEQTPQNLTIIFRSDDNGETWHYVNELMPCFWGKLFIHKGELYMLSVSTEYGDLLIAKSTDGGKSFPAPTALLRGANGKSTGSGVHKNPQNMLRHKGRLYGTLEWGSWRNSDYRHAAMVMSIDEDDDLLVPENRTFTEPVKFDYFAPELEGLPRNAMTIEGTLVLAPGGKLLNIMRFEEISNELTPLLQ